MKLTAKILLYGVVFLAVAGALAVHAETSARKKARYFYAAGVQAQAREQEDAAYEFYKRAYMADPTFPEAAYAYGSRRLYIGLDTLQSDYELGRSLNMMNEYIDTYPDDLYENLFYGYVAGQLDELDESVRVLERTYTKHPDSANILLQLSEAYAHKNDLPKAVESIDRYEKQVGMSSQITTRKLSYLWAQNDTTATLAEVTRLVNSNPYDPSFYILKGNVFDIISMPDSALIYYEKAERIDPESSRAKLALAGAYHANGDSVAYDNKMYEVLLTEDLDLDQKVDLVAEYLQLLINDNLDRKRGDHLFSVLENQYPHEPRVLDLSARYNAAKHNYDIAEEQISYAIDLDPTNVTYWGQLMTYQAAGRNPDEALETYERAKTHIVPDEQLQFYYASVAQMTKKYDKAAEVYHTMIKDIQDDLKSDSLISLKDIRKDITASELDRLSSLFVALGDVYNLAGEKQRSYTMYENAIICDDSNAMAKNNYAYFLSVDGGDLDRALELSSQVMAGFEAENPTYIDTYAWICFLRGDVEKAKENQLKAVELMEAEDYKSPEIYAHLGDILAAGDDWNGAVEAWRKAEKIMIDDEDTDEDELEAIREKIKNGEPKMKHESGKVESQEKESVNVETIE